MEQTLSKVQVSNRVDSVFEDNRARKLTIPMAPVMLNSFHMPLVYNNNDFLSFTVVDVGKQILISFVNENLFNSREKDVKVLNVPVDQMLIEAFLSESSGSSLSYLLPV